MRHLALFEREVIMVLWREGRSATEIAAITGRDKSTISRELSRNMCAKGTSHEYYRASTAQKRYEARRGNCRRPRILDDGNLFELVKAKFIDEQWSPEQIEGRLALELGSSPESDAAICREIRRGRFDACIGGRKAEAGLRHRGRRRKGKELVRHGRITEETGIEFCFALPHHPWQRGTSESIDELLREYFPKGKSLASDLNDVSANAILPRCRVSSPFRMRRLSPPGQSV